MAYIVIESSVRTHRKMLAAGPAACWLWACGLGYCQEGLTDGLIPASALSFLGVKSPQKLAVKLVSVGLWDDEPNGWRVHDYHEHNKSAEAIRGTMRRRADAGKEGGRPRKHPKLPDVPGVYFIHADGLIKIGCTDSLHDRAASFTARAGVMVLMWNETTSNGALELEQELHREFAHLRKRGEWFTPEAELRRFIVENPRGFSTHNYPENPLLSYPTSLPTVLPTDRPTDLPAERVRDDDGRVPSDSGAWNVACKDSYGSLIDGRAQRRHQGHAWCAEREGFCIPYFLHAEFTGKLGTASADEDLQAWYPAALTRFAGRAVGEDSLTFWRNNFAVWVGTATSKPTGSNRPVVGSPDYYAARPDWREDCKAQHEGACDSSAAHRHRLDMDAAQQERA